MKNMIKLDKKGFTLVELLAVIVILALLIVITANTVLPMMGNTKKSGMVTYADKVLSNATANVQADVLVNADDPTFYYPITALMDQKDYFGCVKVSEKENSDGYNYYIKIFSASDQYYFEADSTNSDDEDTIGTIASNGTISGINLNNIEFKLSTGNELIDDKDTRIETVEDLCNPTDFDDIGVDDVQQSAV